jgi:hypothetical protein
VGTGVGVGDGLHRAAVSPAAALSTRTTLRIVGVDVGAGVAAHAKRAATNSATAAMRAQDRKGPSPLCRNLGGY